MAIYDINGDEIISEQPVIEPADTDIPIISITGQLYETKAEGESNVIVDYKSNTAHFVDYAKAKVQGDSSQMYPKKNYTLKLYKDTQRTSKSKRLFRDWDKARSKFVLKANWIDHSHARNVVNARLWTQIMKSRPDYNQLPETLRKSNLAIDGFPVRVYNNGVYMGLYTFNLPKDSMYGVDSDIEQHSIVQSQGNPNGDGLSMFFKESNMNDGKWSDELHDTMSSTIRSSWNSVLQFVNEATDTDFKANFNEHIDLLSAIDVHIFIQITLLRDQIGKNQTFFTYDASKWYHGMYDMDGAWGLPPIEPENGWQDPTYLFQNKYIGYSYSQGNRLHDRLTALFLPEITSRYQQLRNSVLSEDNIISEFDKFTTPIPPYIYEEDYAETTGGGAFTNIPLATTNNILQIRDFVPKRLAYIDANLK